MAKVAKAMDPSDLEEPHQEILGVLREEGRCPPRRIMRLTDMPKSTFYYHLNKLLGADYVTQVERGLYELGDDPGEKDE